MKDILILALIVGCTLWALKEPIVGVLSWTAVSLGSPHIQFGYAAADWPVAMAFAAVTMVGVFTSKHRHNPFEGTAPKFLLAFWIWTCITLPFSIFFDPSFDLWVRSCKIWGLLFASMALIGNRRQLDAFIWVIVASVGYYGVKGGVFTIATGGNHRVWGPGGFIEGNNEVALAVLVVMPLMRYLQMQMQRKWARVAATVCLVLCAATALGTQSRGALLGLGAMGAFFWWKGDQKLLWGMLILLVIPVLLGLMPDAWWERMNTIKTYQSDDSAMGRINAWGMAFNLANSRLFGGGYFIWTGSVFQIYSPNPTDVHAAHSIYFQVLGEHGWIGLALFLSIGVATWFTAQDLVRTSRKHHKLKWAGDLGAMVQVSMIAYGVTGAFLSLSYYDLPYNVMAITVLARRFARIELAALQVSQPVQTAAPPPARMQPSGAI